jgi:hypothetical protein
MLYAHLASHNYTDAIVMLERDVTRADVRVCGEMLDVKSLTGVGFSNARVAELVDARDLKCPPPVVPTLGTTSGDHSVASATSTPPERDVM